MLPVQKLQQAWRRFRRQKIITLLELATLLGGSLATARRRLKGWQALTSYNQNGRYYTLPEVPQFDVHGLWRYRGVFFSQHGNLTQTVLHLVHGCPAGLDGTQLGELLGLDPRSFLSAFRDHRALRREKHQGRLIYFASPPQRYREQKTQRLRLAGPPQLPPEREAVAILVEKIKHPELSLEQIGQRLHKQFPAITPQVVSELFAHHGLAVKKTPPSL